MLNYRMTEYKKRKVEEYKQALEEFLAEGGRITKDWEVIKPEDNGDYKSKSKTVKGLYYAHWD